MSTDIATYAMSVPATPPPTPADFKNDADHQQKIYISSAKLQLKLSAVQNTKDYVWHTQVVTQSAAEPAQEVAETVVKQSTAAVAAAAPKPAETVNRNLFTPALKHGDKPGSLAATLHNFIDVERYHSERNQLESKEAKVNETESTYI